MDVSYRVRKCRTRQRMVIKCGLRYGEFKNEESLKRVINGYESEGEFVALLVHRHCGPLASISKRPVRRIADFLESVRADFGDLFEFMFLLAEICIV